ncbi:MAG: hypothetical protein HYZ45_02790 [Burkholderiales bacterium]|nr:hypothetical protein [Burkholderiales bacterium]
MNQYPHDTDGLRAEIAIAAARMIAEDGADYSTAKRKAARQILGTAVHGDMLPDNAQIEEEVRAYNELFLADSQPQRLLQLRQLACRLMQELERFNPYISGAVVNGTAGEHSDIHLQLFYDNPKDVEIFLLNKNVNFEVSEEQNPRPRRMEAMEVISFMWQGEGVMLSLYAQDDVRGALKAKPDGKPQRLSLAGLQALIAADGAQTTAES